MQMGFLGAVLTLASRPLFFWHLTTTQRLGPHAAQDQQLGGVFMWVPGIVLFLWAALRSLQRLWDALDEGASRHERGCDSARAISMRPGTRAERILPLTWFMLRRLDRRLRHHRCAAVDRRARAPVPVAAADRDPRVKPSSAAATAALDQRRATISAVPLLVALVWTMVTLAAVPGRRANPGLVLDVTGHQWWWEVSYDATEPAQIFTTANEIHIPVGEPVLVRLHGGGCHPQLLGAASSPARPTPFPGQTNLSWLRGATSPGVYRGQCTEYCGAQHAHMALRGGRRAAGGVRAMARTPAAARGRTDRPAAAARAGAGGIPLRPVSPGSRHAAPARISAPDLTHLDEPPHDRRRDCCPTTPAISPAGSRIRRPSSPAT